MSGTTAPTNLLSPHFGQFGIGGGRGGSPTGVGRNVSLHFGQRRTSQPACLPHFGQVAACSGNVSLSVPAKPWPHAAHCKLAVQECRLVLRPPSLFPNQRMAAAASVAAETTRAIHGRRAKTRPAPSRAKVRGVARA